METIEIEINTDQIMRQLSILNYDVTGMINRTIIKKWLNELEKQVNKVNPDFIVLQSCCRYILFELHRKEWCKYYFLTSQYEANKPITKSHMILSRYPLTKNDNLGSTHIVQVRIPFNDVPMRYEYEDLDVQQINLDNITFVVATQIDNNIEKIIQSETSTPNPPTVIVFGLKELINDQFQTISSDGYVINYQSEGWKNTSYNENVLQFEMINYD